MLVFGGVCLELFQAVETEIWEAIHWDADDSLSPKKCIEGVQLARNPDMFWNCIFFGPTEIS